LVCFNIGRNTVRRVEFLRIYTHFLRVSANQETLVEILQFLQEITPDEEWSGKRRTESGSAGTLLQTADKWKLEASFDFNRLNVLLLRGMVGKDGNRSGRKIATATACDARVGFSLGKIPSIYLKAISAIGFFLQVTMC